MKFTPEDIKELALNEVFVYGSNRAGRHGAGAARVALKFGAQHGKTGLVAQTYGLSTKDENIRVLPLSEIEKEIIAFLKVVKSNPKKKFLLTKVGTGLSGYSIPDIANLFADKNLPENLILPEEFSEQIELYNLINNN